MLKRIKDCKKNIKRGWRLKKGRREEIILENPEYGRVEIVANCKGGYDQIIYIEPTGGVIVVLVDEIKNKIYLHVEERPAVIKEGAPKIEKGKLDISLSNLGRDSIETVRGFSEGSWIETAVKEIKEETGIKLTENNLEKIGEVNSNTGFVVSNVSVVLGKTDSNNYLKEISGEERKKIKSRGWYKIEEIKKMIREKKIFCAYTLAALNIYFQSRERK